MKRVPVVALVVAVVMSLVAGVVVGFVLGVAATEAGREFLRDIVENEQAADVATPQHMERPRFTLQYPGNWYVDLKDEDYDPDHLFSIDSPGSAYVMFVLGPFESDPEEALRDQIAAFESLLGSPAITRFAQYGDLAGKGATLRGRIMGIRTTVRTFCAFERGQTVIITEQFPHDDEHFVKERLALIERSFVLRSDTNDPE